MLAPKLTEDWFRECGGRKLTEIKAISRLNSKNCKQVFSKTIPKALRDEGWNAFLIIKNHKDRWKYMGFNVDNIAGALHIVNQPEFIWSGYVFHDKVWYAVDAAALIDGRIPASSAIIAPEIEHAST